MSCLPVPSHPVPIEPMPGYDPYSGALHSVMAGELREIRDMLEKLAEVLVADEQFAQAHIEQLQSFDYLIQHSDECANLLERIANGEDSLTAIGHVRLAEVQERIRDALSGKWIGFTDDE
jgi:arginine deiminase